MGRDLACGPAEHVPVGLLSKRDCTQTPPWFSRKSRYAPCFGNALVPLINGERAFAALQDALEGAAQSIEIITWGFDPSMRLRPPRGPRLGELLRRKAEGGVAVRVLVWKSALANLVENNIIGDGQLGSGGGSAGIGSGIGSTSARDAGSGGATPYGSAASGTGSAGILKGDPGARAFNRAWFENPHENLLFRARDFGFLPVRAYAALAVVLPLYGAQEAALLTTASHHQKMVLIDYETPGSATGFVMGHNLLRNYWDTDAHECFDARRLGFGPWQDLSSQVWGEVLWCLNDNFAAAWERAEPWFGKARALPESRRRVPSSAFAEAAARRGAPGMAQICRTQPEEGERSILDLYHIALANARNYVYIENQYFRHAELALRLRDGYRRLKAAGWARELYVFVVTNVPDGKGRMNTYDMLSALGKGVLMPRIDEKLQEKNPETEKKREQKQRDLEGMNIHVCTLCASDWAPQEAPLATWSASAGPMGLPGANLWQPPPRATYRDIYVHSKLLLVDDVFFTLGSANVNERSMKSDSELNIAMPSPPLTKEWRMKLWELHTGWEPGEDMALEFDKWGKLMARNAQHKEKNEPLKAPLIEFYDDSPSGWRLD